MYPILDRIGYFLWTLSYILSDYICRLLSLALFSGGPVWSDLGEMAFVSNLFFCKRFLFSFVPLPLFRRSHDLPPRYSHPPHAPLYSPL